MGLRYPVLLDLDDRSCLVVGGGPVAQRKAAGLLAAGADVTVVSPELCDALHAAVHDGRVHLVSRAYRSSDVNGADATPWAVVVAATDDPAVNAQVTADATEARAWANNATEPDGGPASLPAVHRHGALTLAVSTGGAHPGAAAWLRDLAAGAIGDEYVTALDLIAEVRATAPQSARPDWRAAVDSGMLDLIRAGHVAEAKERLQACLSSSSD